MENAQWGAKYVQVIKGTLIEAPNHVWLTGQISNESPHLATLHQHV
jgi:hypothetical protein